MCSSFRPINYCSITLGRRWSRAACCAVMPDGHDGLESGRKTAAEIALGMNCFAYGENPGSDDWVLADHLVANVEKVPQLAQRWSLDPAGIDLRLALAQQSGIAGNAAGS